MVPLLAVERSLWTGDLLFPWLFPWLSPRAQWEWNGHSGMPWDEPHQHTELLQHSAIRDIIPGTVERSLC